MIANKIAKDDAEAEEKAAAKPTDEVCSDCEPQADELEELTKEDGFESLKKNGGKVKNPNGTGRVRLDSKGDVWVPTGHGPSAHGGPHWDVQSQGGGYRNVYAGGRVRGGK